MLETSRNGARAADGAAAGCEDQGGVAELGFVAGGRAAPAGVPDPELTLQAKRRTFTAKYKLEILAKADACTRPGEIGELLRREGLYTSHLTYWRKQVRDGALKELGKPRGRRPADRRDEQITELTRRAERAEAELAKAKKVIEIQGISQRCWSRCSVPRARAGAPSDDRADSRRADADHRHPPGVPGCGRVCGDDLPPPAATGAPAATAAARARQGAVRARA
jgi:transposase